MLLTEAEIQTALDAQFKQLEPTVTGLRLAPPGLPTKTLSNVAGTLGERLPEEFVRLVSMYNFGSLTIGAVAFGNSGSYDGELLDYNATAASSASWWSTGPRPAGQLMIANSDAFAFLLHCSSGAIFALEHGKDLEASAKVACDFRRFFRGVGSVFVQRQLEGARGDLGDLLADEVGAEEAGRRFWRELAS